MEMTRDLLRRKELERRRGKWRIKWREREKVMHDGSPGEMAKCLTHKCEAWICSECFWLVWEGSRRKVLKQEAKEELSEWGEQMHLQQKWFWEGMLAVPTTQCCNGGTTKSSISQKHKRARETTIRTSKKRMRDGQRKRHRWLLKCVSALV